MLPPHSGRRVQVISPVLQTKAVEQWIAETLNASGTENRIAGKAV